MFSWKNAGNINYLQLDKMAAQGIKAVFTSRQGGVSSGNYNSLNLGLHTRDDSDSVIENRKRIAAVLQINPYDFTAAEQVHGDKIYIVQEEDKGKGALELSSSIKEVDALITAVRGIPLISFYADCVPLLIYDPVKEVAALAHAGWKGTFLEIGPKTIIKMQQVFGTNPHDCLAGIGPAISQTNYEVDERVKNHFSGKFTFYNEIIKSKSNGQYNLDLKKANLLLLQEAGLLEKNIAVSNLCTYQCNDLFYSYRRDDGQTGRMASIIEL